MAKEIIIAVLFLVAVSVFIGVSELTGKVIENSCSGTNNYYLCVDGNGDFVLDGNAVHISEINETIEGYKCKLVPLENNEEFFFRYNGAVKGVIYNSDRVFIGENINGYSKANYRCSVDANCNLLCSEHISWQ